jgi:hypothetical protein
MTKLAITAASSLAAAVIFSFTTDAQTLPYGNPNVESIVNILPDGARGHLAPNQQSFVFDARTSSGSTGSGGYNGYYDVFSSDLNGNLLASMTLGKSGIGQLDNGNAIYHPSGAYVGFISEAPVHYLSTMPPIGQLPIGDPGMGLFSNLWFTNGVDFWQGTNIPIKQTQNDGIPTYATVNPRFTPDGKSVIWTQRYGDGEPFNWGSWRLVEADLVPLQPSGIALSNIRVIFTPQEGFYVTAMDFITPTQLLVSGNLDGQNIYGMDLYNLNLTTGTYTNLTNTPTYWEEGACIAPSGTIVYMTDMDSDYSLNFNEFWVGQPLQRDYYTMNSDGSNKTRLTYFNVPGTADYTTWNSLAIICDISADGKTVVGTIGRDYGTATQAYVVWQIELIHLINPL